MAATGQSAEWSTDARAAQAKAKRENKFVFLDFTGSDWCGWCKKLKKEVFDQPEFGEFAQANLVCVEVDFPHRTQLEPAQAQANNRLARTYHVTGYPTIIILDGDGHMVGQAGYIAGGPAVFDAKVDAMLKHSHKAPEPSPQKELEPPRKPVVLEPIAPAIPMQYGALALKGISGAKSRRIVMINNANLMVGETAEVKTQGRDVVVC